MIIVSRTGIIVADSLLVLITWFSLFRKDAKYRLTFSTATLAEVLLRDGQCTVLTLAPPRLTHFPGTIYFVFVISLHVLPLPPLLISLKFSVLVIINTLHLAFSVASVSALFIPIFTNTEP